MKILFISRTYPPNIGGMENYAYNLHRQFKNGNQLYDIILTKKAKHLIWFYPWIYFYGTFLVLTKKIDVIYVGDGLLSICAVFFQKILRKKVILTIYGLDVIYDKLFYQKMQKIFLPKLNRIIAISEATAQEAIKRGVNKNRISIIPVGVETDNVKIIDKETAINTIQNQFDFNLNKKIILFTIGRLVKRKGVYWFVENVMPKLDKKFIFCIAGGGPEYDSIAHLITKKGLSSRVFLFGRVDDKEKNLLFSLSDCFISPNISIKNDMEGFGIVNLEAGLYGLPVVASNIEGIKDAVSDNETGFLVSEQNITEFIDAIKNLNHFNKIQINDYILKYFSWGTIYNSYMKVINEF